ncbi:hypothetical protein LJR129_005045 [Acidovorax sp. LjRoot129]|uniref:hypothetical protein n=1 Tax=unclassified Acidovorax TaxID=2684926 RepID=UPI003ECD9D07
MYLDFADEVDQEQVDEVKTLPVRPEPKIIDVPAQTWEVASKAYCAPRLAEAKTGDVVTVPTFEHSGFLHAVFACRYGGYTGVYLVEAWQLIPRRVYSGPITPNVHWLDYDESVRARGDYTGLLVKVNGVEMVCAKSVHFNRTVPTVAPISLAAAVSFDMGQRQWGWRSMKYDQANVSWGIFNGHPVVVYDAGDDERVAMLLWKHEGRTEEYLLPSSFDLTNLTFVTPPETIGDETDSPEPELQQAALF